MIRLIEITTSVPERQRVEPRRLPADPPFLEHPAALIVLHPGDWARVLGGELALPDAYASRVQLH